MKTKNNLMCKEDILPEGIPLDIAHREMVCNFKEQGYFGLAKVSILLEKTFHFLKNKNILK